MKLLKNTIKRWIAKSIWTIPKRYVLWKLFGYGKAQNFPHYLSIALIIKNEAPYIAEWIEYHLLVGVTKFYIYDNGSTDNLKQILEPYIKEGIVTYVYYPGHHQQVNAMNNAIRKSLKETFWLACIDTDEFIVPISTLSLPEFLQNFEDVPGLEINWLMYGDNGQERKTEGLIIERFRTRSFEEFAVNKHVKSIVNPRAVYMAGVHNAVYFDAQYSVNTNKVANKHYFSDRNGCFDKVVINHYFTRSLEEYLLKQKVGRADSSPQRNMIFYEMYNKNDVLDNTMDKYIPLIKEKLKEREVKSVQV
jgi:glycosyltransferase involved in cell wall biosynthesis